MYRSKSALSLLRRATYALVVSTASFECIATETEPGRMANTQSSALQEKVEDVYVVVYGKEYKESILGGKTQSEYSTRESRLQGYTVDQQKVRSFVEQDLKSHGIDPTRVDRIYSKVFAGFSGRFSEADVNTLDKMDSIWLLEKDQIVSIPESSTSDDAPAMPLETEQEIPWGIDLVGTADNENAYYWAWVLDTGIQLDHPDLNVDRYFARGFIESDDQDFDDPGDRHSHGTHVAGTIAAKDNWFGVVGVAAGATVVPIRVVNSEGIGTVSSIVAGVDYVASIAYPNDVANMSLWMYVDDSTWAMDEAVVELASLGVQVFICAGNKDQNTYYFSPAHMGREPNVHVITALDVLDESGALEVWSRSNYGAETEYAQPGAGTLSTSIDSGYAVKSGTSMATPHAAGIFLSEANGNGRFGSLGWVYKRGYYDQVLSLEP